jgi:uncharacterized LabA/DUF88 family protein
VTTPAEAAAEPVATPLEREPAPEIAPVAVAPQPRRYRFERRHPGVAAAVTPVRPERLSVGRVTPEEESLPAAEPVAGATPEEPGARADVALVSPEDRTREAVDDIVTALGLREAAPRPEPLIAREEAPAEEPEAPTGPEAETAPTARRRRRRRRGTGTHAVLPEEEAGEEAGEPAWPHAGLPEELAPESHAERGVRNGYEPYPPQIYEGEEAAYPPYSPHLRSTPERRQNWDITGSQQAVRQPESPFGAPEPSYVRGFGPQPRGVAGPAREVYTRPGRGTDVPPMSSNQLANTVTQAIQQQTDRLLTELRHQQNPPSMTVMFPPFPSTERVGVFVDVANLFYSSRSMRISLDFGRLLDFLRGNRRLVRAHAYAPTNPEPNAEQAFLSAVKGLGYRITTKNYKTFSSGAKKADLDLDLCMDIVRLVEAKALDTVVLVSGDSDFLPLLEYCSDHGVRVEVAAFEDAASMILRQSCDLFINLSLVEDIRL